jgi:hypothetical protein
MKKWIGLVLSVVFGWLLVVEGGAGVLVANGSVQFTGNRTAYETRAYRIPVAANQRLRVRAYANSGDGEVDVYVRLNADPTPSNYYLTAGTPPGGSVMNEIIDFAVPEAGDWHIVVRGRNNNWTRVVRAVVYSDLRCNILAVTSASLGINRFYRFIVPSDQRTLQLNTWGGTGNADVYVKEGEVPMGYDSELHSKNLGNTEQVVSNRPSFNSSGTYFVYVKATAAYSSLSVKAIHYSSLGWGEQSRVRDGNANDARYYAMPGFSGGPIYVQSWGGSGNADLYMRVGDLPTSSIWNYSSTGSTSEELIEASNAATGQWWLRVGGASIHDCLFAAYAGTAAAAPTHSPAGGTYASPQTVTVSGVDGNRAAARYTTDGSRPNPESPVFPSAGLSVDATATLRTRAFPESPYKSSTTPSAQRTATYTITGSESSSPIYRFWSPAYNGHFFTISASERDHINATWPDVWEYEGPAMKAHAATASGTSPVYRFWSASFRRHFFTISESEKNHIQATWPDIWQYEGVAWHAFTATGTGRLPVHRFWSSAFKGHFYTISESEKNHIQATWPDVWSYEGIAYYALPTSAKSKSMAALAPEPDSEPTAEARRTATADASPGVDRADANDFAEESQEGTFFPLRFGDAFVAASVYDPAQSTWSHLLPATWSPEGVFVPSAGSGRRWLAVLVMEKDVEAWRLAHGSWLGWTVEPPDEEVEAILEPSPEGLGLPVEALTLPEASETLTLRVRDLADDRPIQAISGLAGGTIHEWAVPSWNRWYRLDFVCESDGTLIEYHFVGHFWTH